MNEPKAQPWDIETMKLIAEGYNNEEVAIKLFISPRTVENRIAKLKAVFKARTKYHLIYIMAKINLI